MGAACVSPPPRSTETRSDKEPFFPAVPFTEDLADPGHVGGTVVLRDAPRASTAVAAEGTSSPTQAPEAAAVDEVLVGPTPSSSSTAAATPEVIGKANPASQRNKAIRSGTRLLAREEEPIFESPSSWIVIGCVQEGAMVTAAGKVTIEEGGCEMVPIRPRGAIELLNFEVAVAKAGTILVAIEDEPIYAGPASWDDIGTIAVGQTVTAAGSTVQVDEYEMLPIQPDGAVECRAFRIQDQSKIVDRRRKRQKTEAGPAKPAKEEIALAIRSTRAGLKSKQELAMQKEIEAERNAKPKSKDGMRWVNGRLEFVDDDDEDDEATLATMSPVEREYAFTRQKAGLKKVGPQGECPTQ